MVAFLDLLDEANKRFPAPHPKSQAIIVSSIVAYARSGFPYAYSASKAGLVHLTKQLSSSFAPYKIRFNCIAPGWFPSEMTNHLPFIKHPEDPTSEGSVAPEVAPLERTGSDDDINGLILFLASRAGAYVSGSIQLTDGGNLSAVPSSY